MQKPFAELSVVQRIIKYSQICQYKYFKVLIQEFHIKVDLGFVNAVCNLLQSSEYSEEEEVSWQNNYMAKLLSNLYNFRENNFWKTLNWWINLCLHMYQPNLYKNKRTFMTCFIFRHLRFTLVFQWQVVLHFKVAIPPIF